MSLEERVKELERKEALFTIGFKLIWRNLIGKMTDEELKRELGKAIEEIEGQ